MDLDTDEPTEYPKTESQIVEHLEAILLNMQFVTRETENLLKQLEERQK